MAYSRGVTATIQLLLVPIFALSWGLPLYGQWLMLSSIPAFLAMSDLGFSTTAGMRIIAEVARDSYHDALITYRSAWRVSLLLSAIVVVGAAIIIVILPNQMLLVEGGMDGGEAREVLIALAMFGLLVLQSPLLTAITRATGKTAQGIAIEGTMPLLEGVAAAAIVLAGGKPLQVAISMLLLRGIGLAAYFAYVRAIAPWLAAEARASWARIRTMWRPAIATMAVSLSQAGYLQGSALAVGAAGGAALVPLYTSLRTLSRIGLQAALMVVVPLMPDYASARARGNDRRSALIIGAVAATLLAMGIGYALLLSILGRPLLEVWTHDAIHPPKMMIILSATAAAMSIVWIPLSYLLISINRQETFAYIFCLCAAATVALVFPLIAVAGVTGAAVANTILDTIMVTIVMYSLYKHGGPLEMRPSALAAAFLTRKVGTTNLA